MKISVRLSSMEESNRFLRSLWSTLRATFAGIAWQYLPRRYGHHRFIRIGFASIPGQEQIQFGFTYRKRGVIDAVLFDQAPFAPSPPTAPLCEKLKQCALQAKENLEKTQWFHFQATVNMPHVRYNTAFYQYEHFRLMPIQPQWSSVALNIAGYDSKDASFLFQHRLRGILDLLSSWTNVAWIEQRLETAPENGTHIEANTLWADNEWLDDVPDVNGYLCLARDQVAFCDSFAEGKISYDDDLVRAAHHFHKALRLARLGGPEDYDLATTLLMSALEVVSLARSQQGRCSACGQMTHRISQRIKQLAHDTLGPGLESLFNEYYSRRSKYLHAGILQNEWPWGQPLIDLTADQDLSHSMSQTYPHNLLEFTSFILRVSCLTRQQELIGTGPDSGKSTADAGPEGGQSGSR